PRDGVAGTACRIRHVHGDHAGRIVLGGGRGGPQRGGEHACRATPFPCHWHFLSVLFVVVKVRSGPCVTSIARPHGDAQLYERWGKVPRGRQSGAGLKLAPWGGGNIALLGG